LCGDLSIHIVQQTPRPGQVVVEALFLIPLSTDASRKRRPDLAFVSADRWPIDRPVSLRQDAWDVVPDLTVEVVSPTDIAQDLLGKVKEYFQAGVRLVWVVYPIQRCIHVYEAWNRIRVVTETDELDGGEVLPGFRRSLDGLFGPVAAENGEPS
jgi:Uma2 family endonuclease